MLPPTVLPPAQAYLVGRVDSTTKRCQTEGGRGTRADSLCLPLRDDLLRLFYRVAYRAYSDPRSPAALGSLNVE